MAQINGVVQVRHGGKSYSLILGMSGLAKLQREYDQSLSIFQEMEEEGKVPDFGALLRVVEIGLERFHGDADPYLADDLMRAKPELPVELVNAAFATMDGGAEGNGSPETGKAQARPAKRSRKGR